MLNIKKEKDYYNFLGDFNSNEILNIELSSELNLDLCDIKLSFSHFIF